MSKRGFEFSIVLIYGLRRANPTYLTRKGGIGFIVIFMCRITLR
jgi:hypothetical protein